MKNKFSLIIISSSLSIPILANPVDTIGGRNIHTPEIVISANRQIQERVKTPQQISIIKADDIELLNPETAADMLTASGHVYIQKSQLAGGSPLIHGFSTSRLLYTVDGTRMNTAIFRSGNLQNVISLDPFQMERVEILYGPNSVVYGSDAIGGVMSFYTLQPEFSSNNKIQTKGNALGRYSSANSEKTGHVDFSIMGKRWASVTSISHNDFGDLKMGSHGPSMYLRPFYVQRINGKDVVVDNSDPRKQTPSGYSQTNYLQKLSFKANDFLQFNYAFHYSETSDYARYDRHIQYKKGKPRYGEYYYGPQKWSMNQLTIDYSKSNVLFDKMNLNFAYQYFEESRYSRNINDSIKQGNIEQVRAYSLNADFHKHLSTNNQLSYGIEAVIDKVVSKGNKYNLNTSEYSLAASRYPASTWSTYSGYITDTHDFSNRFTLQAGIRYSLYHIKSNFDSIFMATYPVPEQHVKTNNGALTGSLGFTWRPQSSWLINGSFSTGFRAPNVDDMGKVSESKAGSIVVPNPNVKAEYVYNFDLGLAKTFGNFLNLEISGFYSYLNNALVKRDYTAYGDSIMYKGILSKVQAIQNSSSAYVYGIQAGAEVVAPCGFNLKAHINYQKGKEELDNGSTANMRSLAPLYGDIRLGYTIGKLSMELSTTISSQVAYKDLAPSEQDKAYLYPADKDGKPYCPRWYTINYKARYRFNHILTVTAGIENITDQRYRTYSSGITAPGRNFIMALKASF